MSYHAESESLKTAIKEAERFLDRCKDVLEEERRVALEREDARRIGRETWGIHASRSPHAAAKRASMDLTRALANLRKPGAF